MTDSIDFPSLPVLERIVSAAAPAVPTQIRNTTFVLCQHLLLTTGSLIEALIRLGASPSRIHVLGKIYSTSSSVAAGLRSLGVHVLPGSAAALPGRFEDAIRLDSILLWKQVIEGLQHNPSTEVVLLDDGGHLTKTVPREVSARVQIVAIEQTSSGIVPASPVVRGFPVVEVASSAVKRRLESPMIASAILRCAKRYSGLGPDVGVIGYGNLGRALTRELLSRRCTVRTFDRASARQVAGRVSPGKGMEHPASSIGEVLEHCKVVFGCTGTDCIRPSQVPETVRGERILMSCSSGDVEFRSILREWSPVPSGELSSPCPTITCSGWASQVSCVIPRSGFPVNFDNSLESVPASMIQLTRGLLLGGVLQAVDLMRGSSKSLIAGVMLDPAIQALAVEAWRESGGRIRKSQADRYAKADWVALESGGVRVRAGELMERMARR